MESVKEFLKRRVTLPVWALVVAGLLLVALGSAGNQADDAEVAATNATATTFPPLRATAPSTTTTEATTRATTAPSTTTTTTAALPPLPAGDDATVSRVIDGDTIDVATGVRVRFIGIDTPETKDPRRPVGCFGAEASRRTAELVPRGTPVRLVYDVERRDRFGRTLAYLYRLSDGLFVNATLVSEGFAQVATYPPNVAHAETFVALQREAREAGRGLWGACPVAEGPAQRSPAPTPATTIGATTTPSGAGGGNCDASYPDFCIPPPPPDLDCKDVAGRNFTVRPPDPHRFDADRNGVGCES